MTKGYDTSRAYLLQIAAFLAIVTVGSESLFALSPNDEFYVDTDLNYDAAILQPDGKIVIAGTFQATVPIVSKIIRLHHNGKLDEDFAEPLSNSQINDLALQPDGKIMVAGNIFADSTSWRHINRLTADGHRDASFTPPPINNRVTHVIVQPDVNIFIGGRFTEVGGEARPGLARLNSDGTLDQDFAPEISSDSNIWLSTLSLQSDGKIIFGGQFSEVSGETISGIARLHTNGELDQSFVAEIDTYEAYATIIQPDGKIVVSYFVGLDPNETESSIARLNSDGSLDQAFSSPIYGTFSRTLSTLALQPDGKILVGDSVTIPGIDGRSHLVRLHTDGSIDNQFFPTQVQFGVHSRSIRDPLIQPDGKIFLGGVYSKVNGHGSESGSNIFARLYPDGTPDWTLLTAVTDVQSSLPRVNAIASDQGNKIYMGGNFDWVHQVGEPHWHGEQLRNLARLSPNGELDDSFTPESNPSVVFSSAVQPDIGTILGRQNAISRLTDEGINDPGFADWGTNGAVRALVLQADGKILTAGAFTEISSPNDQAFPRNRLIRLDNNGNLDNSFLFTGPNGPNDSVFSMALQPDGKILVAGAFTAFNGNSTPSYIVRLNPDGAVDTGFNPPALNNGVYALTIQGDGKIVIGGAFTTIDTFTSQRRIARLNPNGSIDTSFMSGLVTNPGMNATVRALALQADGKIWAAGDFTSITVGVGTETTTRIVRLHPSGALDKAFPEGANGRVNALALQTDGKLLVGCEFSALAN
ncbi:MAG: hypothetical protein LAT56_03640 [Wenzhouxiangella sp.]|nr:hypothetical protein [Wenzhouxiangella sp.]